MRSTANIEKKNQKKKSKKLKIEIMISTPKSKIEKIENRSKL